MKKIIALLLALVMVFALCACGGDTTTPDDADQQSGDVSADTNTPDDTADTTDDAENADTLEAATVNIYIAASLEGAF